MLVGPTGGGKSQCQNVLRGAISNLDGLQEFRKINLEVINPKSITLFELYGFSEEINWNEGVLEMVFEKCI